MLGWWRTIAGLLRAELQRSERCGTGGTELEKGGGGRRLEVWNGDSGDGGVGRDKCRSDCVNERL